MLHGAACDGRVRLLRLRALLVVATRSAPASISDHPAAALPGVASRQARNQRRTHVLVDRVDRCSGAGRSCLVVERTSAQRRESRGRPANPQDRRRSWQPIRRGWWGLTAVPGSDGVTWMRADRSRRRPELGMGARCAPGSSLRGHGTPSSRGRRGCAHRLASEG